MAIILSDSYNITSVLLFGRDIIQNFYVNSELKGYLSVLSLSENVHFTDLGKNNFIQHGESSSDCITRVLLIRVDDEKPNSGMKNESDFNTSETPPKVPCLRDLINDK